MTSHGKVNLISPVDEDISHIYWQSVTINSLEFFYLKEDTRECRKLIVKLDYSNYKMSGRQDMDVKRSGPAVVKVDHYVLAISGKGLTTVSCHDLKINKWDGNLCEMNEAR